MFILVIKRSISMKEMNYIGQEEEQAACAGCLSCLTCIGCVKCCICVIPVLGQSAVAASAAETIAVATTVGLGVISKK